MIESDHKRYAKQEPPCATGGGPLDENLGDVLDKPSAPERESQRTPAVHRGRPQWACKALLSAEPKD